MYKEKLQEIMLNNLINEKVGVERFIRITEKIERINESKIKSIYNKLKEGPELYIKNNPIIPKVKREYILCLQKCASKAKGFMARNIIDIKGETKQCRQKCKELFVQAKQKAKGK